MAPRSTPTPPLSVTDISKYQDAVLENVRALITEAELLCVHSHFARSFFLSIMSVEETSKVLMLTECAQRLTAGAGLVLVGPGRDQFAGVNDARDRFLVEALARNLPVTFVQPRNRPH